MDIWIIRNGEKTGPIHDYEVRHKIEDGQLDATTPAWHEGLTVWMPLGEMDLFKREFELKPQSPETPQFPDLPHSPAGGPPPVPQPPVLGRRFWARWFDLCVYAGIWWVAMHAAGRDIRGMLGNPWVMFPQYIPWFILEAFLIHHFATTPGKWLMGLAVTNRDGSFLSLAEATRRSARVLFTGIGFGWGLLSIFCQLLSFFTAKRIGVPLWDYAGGHHVTSKPLHAGRIIAMVALFIFSLMLQLNVVMPYILEAAAAESPEIKEQLEKSPFWQVPKRP